MKSDIYIVNLTAGPSLEKELNEIGKAQASRDVPRKLVSVQVDWSTSTAIAIFEII